jgi:argininosuccinate synthase
MKKVILIYSGGLDTSVCIPILREEYGFEEIITVTVDVGQPEKEIKEAEKKARKLKTKHYTIDAKKEFVEEFIYKAIKANGNYQGYPLSTAIARPLITKCAVEVAKKEKTNIFSHGCTGKGNDQFRIEFMLRALMPSAKIIAPIREKNLTRSEEIEYAKKIGIPISQSKKKIWSIDENLWGRSIEGGKLEDPYYSPPEEIYLWTKGYKESPEEPGNLVIEFKNGVPVSLNGEEKDGISLISDLNKIAGNFGVGRIDIIEERIFGLKARENYEAPAAVTILTAHQALEALVLTREELKFKKIVENLWSELAYFGLWISPLKEDLEAFIENTQKRVEGKVKLELFKGNVRVKGRESPFALYEESLVSFDTKDFQQKDAESIVKLHGLSSLIYQRIKEKLK